jgi:L-asparaginase II
MTGAAPIATVTRNVATGPVVESVHVGHVVLVAPDGEVRAVGDADVVVFPRSSVKPLQATACLELLDPALAADLGDDEVAVAWASHRGEDRHVAAVRRLLARSGTPPEALTCPPGWPEAATVWPPVRPLDAPSRLRFNCSGKHAMFALAGRTLGVSGPALLDPDGPLQRHLLAHLDEALGGVQGVAVDGCGAPAVLAPLAGLARAHAAVAGTDRYERVRRAGLAHPALVSGSGRLATALLRHGIVAKGGAEGVFGAGWTDADGGAWGVGVKAEDGAVRGADAATIGLLESLGVLPVGACRPEPVLGGGVPVGVVSASPAVLGLAG